MAEAKGNTTDVLSGILEMGVGGLTGGLGNLLGAGLSSLTDSILGNSSPADSISKSIQDSWDMGLKNQQALNREGMFNAAGLQGSAVANSYKNQADQLGQSAQAVRAANNLRSYGSQGISNALAQGQAGMRNMQGQIGNLKSSFLNSAGTPASARLGIADKIAQAMGTASAQNMAASGGLMQGALEGAAKNESAASNTLSGDIANRYNLYVKPYEAQVNASAMSGINAGIAAGAQGAGIAAEKAATLQNPLEGFAGALGLAGKYDMARGKKGQDWNKFSSPYFDYFRGKQNPGGGGKVSGAGESVGGTDFRNLMDNN